MIIRYCTTVLVLCGAAVITTRVDADTEITYQGQLNQNGSPVTNVCDLRFRLYDMANGGNQIGPTNTKTNVAITNGVFTVELDFEADAFNNSDLWLGIEVRCPAGSGLYIRLNPRQRITRAPYSIQTRGMFVNDNETFVGIGRDFPITPNEHFGINAPTESDFGGMYMSTTGQAGRPFYGYSAGGNIDAYHYFDGATGDWHFLNISGVPLTITNEGNVGIGTTNPGAVLEVNSVFSAIRGESETGTAVAGRTEAGWGVLGQSTATSGRGVYGTATSSTSRNYGVYGESLSRTGGVGVFGFADGTTGINIGVEGRCFSPDGYDFWASGGGTDFGSTSSRRWKHNIEPIDDPLSKLAKLRGVYFDWDQDHGGRHDVGMIAEEVGPVLPEIVVYEKNGIDAQGMDYSKLTPLLVEAVKELNSRQRSTIAVLRREMDEVKQENKNLRERLAALEESMPSLQKNQHITRTSK